MPRCRAAPRTTISSGSATATSVGVRRSRSPRGKESGSDPVEDQGLVGVDGVAAAGAYLEVDVGSGGVAGAADVADLLAADDLVADVDADGALVGVPELGAVGERLDRAVAVGAGVSRL